MALGYFLKGIKLCDEASLKIINKLCFKVFLPIYLFKSVYSTDLSAAFNGKLILFAVIALLVWFGLPVATSICGEKNIGATSLLLGIVVPIFNVLAVVILETFRGGKPSVKKMIKGIITNPLIIASVIGVVLYFLEIGLPYAVEKTVTDLGRVATPLALLALGGEFKFNKVKGDWKQFGFI